MAAHENVNQGQFDLGDTGGRTKYTNHGLPLPQRFTSSGPADRTEALRMFMKPSEITSQYQMLDGDREDYEGESARNWSFTGRPETTVGNGNYKQYTSSGGLQYNSLGNPLYRRAPSEETDEQLLSRKLTESQYPAEHYAEARGALVPEFDADEALGRSSAPKAPGWSANSSRWDSWNAAQDEYLGRKESEFNMTVDNRNIYDKVRDEGVQQPLTLATQGWGSLGKRQLLGGHHRLASALDARPDDYVPVVHAPNIWDAKADKYQKYT